MSSESKQDRQLEIAHVLFIDIVSYSKLPINRQSELLQQLNRIVRATEQFRRAEAADKLVRLPTGDGMALAFFTSPGALCHRNQQICRAGALACRGKGAASGSACPTTPDGNQQRSGRC